MANEAIPATPDTRRETLAAAFEAVEVPETPAAPATNVIPDASGDVQVGETEAQRTERLRDAGGKFATPERAVARTPAVPAAPRQRPDPPTDWAKERRAHWDKLDPDVAEYIVQRQKEQQGGFEKYKGTLEQQYANARALEQAVAPFADELKAQGIPAAHLLSNLTMAHMKLSRGGPQEKLHMFAKLAADYNVPLNLLLHPQAFQMLQQMVPQQQAPDVRTLVRSQLTEVENERAVQQFIADAPTKYPHFEKVRDTMIGLLRSEVAADLPSAYAKAIRLNDETWKEEEARHRAATESERVKQQQAAAAKARSQAVSVKGSTPSGTPADGAKDRRSQIAEAFEAHSGGRL